MEKARERAVYFPHAIMQPRAQCTKFALFAAGGRCGGTASKGKAFPNADCNTDNIDVSTRNRFFTEFYFHANNDA